jgi:hypothetical protein
MAIAILLAILAGVTGCTTSNGAHQSPAQTTTGGGGSGTGGGGY